MTSPLQPPRKGYTRAADIPPDILAALSRGEMESATLAEGLALDQAVLLHHAFPDLPAQATLAAPQLLSQGILKRMNGIGALLQTALGETALARCQEHASDTVRGWACFIVGAMPGLPLEKRLSAILPLADDHHFGVREWAWMAVRPHLATQLDDAIRLMSAWTDSPSERVRRYASEALRPRGVWCSHLPALKQQPALALPVLEPLRADTSTYVQDSVANWLNDAAKDQAEWVKQLCQQWLAGTPAATTQRICCRALRSVKT